MTAEDSESTPPSPDKVLLLEEYKVLNEMARHDDILVWTGLGLFLPAATAVLVFVANHQFTSRPHQQLALQELIAAATVSLLLWLAGWVVAERMHFYTLIRFERARDIEVELSMNHHLRIDAKDASKPRGICERVGRFGVMCTIRTSGPVLFALWFVAIWWWAF
jgi:hypothetical protein